MTSIDGRNRDAIQSLVALSRGCDFRVVAEGIETRHELDVVRGLGLEYAQGYLLR